jgi:hypothetical protein
MNTSVLRALNAETKAWWYHVELRKQGYADEARKRERRSILGHVNDLRTAKLMTIGRGGWTIYKGAHSRLQGYGDGEPYAAILKARGVPVVDSRTIPDSLLWDVAVSGPMPAIDREPDPEPYNGFSYAPLAYVAENYRKAGALVWNV